MIQSVIRILKKCGITEQVDVSKAKATGASGDVAADGDRCKLKLHAVAHHPRDIQHGPLSQTSLLANNFLKCLQN